MVHGIDEMTIKYPAMLLFDLRFDDRRVSILKAAAKLLLPVEHRADQTFTVTVQTAEDAYIFGQECQKAFENIRRAARRGQHMTDHPWRKRQSPKS